MRNFTTSGENELEDLFSFDGGEKGAKTRNFVKKLLAKRIYSRKRLVHPLVTRREFAPYHEKSASVAQEVSRLC